MGTMKALLFLAAIVLVICMIPPGVRAEKQIRSSSLQILITQDKNVQRIDYVDSDGRITFAADKHYATIIKTKTNLFNLVFIYTTFVFDTST